MTVRDLSLIRAYCLQWISSPLWDRNPFRHEVPLAELRRAARRIASPYELMAWVADAMAHGLDPL